MSHLKNWGSLDKLRTPGLHGKASSAHGRVFYLPHDRCVHKQMKVSIFMCFALFDLKKPNLNSQQALNIILE